MSDFTVTKDFTKNLNDIINRFRSDRVLVGVPREESTRAPQPGESESITNAQLLAIHELGSPANNIPARPVLKIGIRNAQEQIAEQFEKAAQQAFKGVGALEKGLDVYYERAGSIAANSVKKAINDQDGIAPIAASTLAQRKARGFKGEKALIVSGQLRNSITYVLRKKGE